VVDENAGFRAKEKYLIRGKILQGWISGIDFPVLIYSQVFKNKDKSSGKLYLVCSDLDCDSDKIKTIYKKRWKVELFHKTLKQNAAMSKSPAHTVCTQSNHLFIAIYSVFRLEIISIMTKLNHFSLRSMIYINALKVAFQQIQQLTRCVT
jgi:IS4 transposase